MSRNYIFGRFSSSVSRSIPFDRVSTWSASLADSLVAPAFGILPSQEPSGSVLLGDLRPEHVETWCSYRPSTLALLYPQGGKGHLHTMTAVSADVSRPWAGATHQTFALPGKDTRLGNLHTISSATLCIELRHSACNRIELIERDNFERQASLIVLVRRYASRYMLKVLAIERLG